MSTATGITLNYVTSAYGSPSRPVDRRIVHPPKAKVFRVDYSDEGLGSWQWLVGYWEDTIGSGPAHHTTRWGSCTRWEDCLEIALAMLAKEQAAYWARIIAQVDAKGIVLPDE